MKITVAGVGYVGLSLAVLLAQKHEVTAITTTEAKAEKLNQFISPIQDDEIERFFREAKAGERTLHLHTTTDKAALTAAPSWSLSLLRRIMMMCIISLIQVLWRTRSSGR